MFVRKIKNRIYTFFKNSIGAISYVDCASNIGNDTKIWQSEILGNANIGNRCLINRALIAGNVSIGNNTSIWGPNIQILSRINKITIGSFCSIARDVSIQEYNHNHQKITTYFIGKNILNGLPKDEIISKGPITIGNDVWIGTGCQILSGVNIGHGSVIGSNTVVTKNIPPYAIFGGNPGKVIKFRFDKIKIQHLLDLNWWEWDIEKIKANKKLFE